MRYHRWEVGAETVSLNSGQVLHGSRAAPGLGAARPLFVGVILRAADNARDLPCLVQQLPCSKADK